MDDYEKKFAEMQKYIPFLEAMIERLQKVTDKSREVQLHKMQQLHGILTDSKRKLRIETLQKCEDVLQKLHSKVEKGTSAGLNFPSGKKCEESSVSKTKPPAKPSEDKSSRKVEKVKEKPKEMDETPASPDAPASPDEQPKSILAPIIIPTERKHDYPSEKIDSKPSSPEPIERVSTMQPIIIPTERKDESLNNADDKPMHTRHLPVPPVPSKSEAQKHIRLTSPECRSPRPKEPFLSPLKTVKPPTPLLISPPRVLTEPPLSMDDLAELLNDGSDSNPGSSHSTILGIDKNFGKPSKPEKIRIPTEKLPEVPKKPEKETLKFVLTQEDIDRESNRRWEETDKHIVLFGRKGIPVESKSQSIIPPSNNLPGPVTPSAPKKVEVRTSPMSPTGKDRGAEPRYADNYERIPRHVTDRFSNASDSPQMPDMNVITSAFSRLSDGDKANLAKLQTNLPILHKQTENFPSAEERERELFSRRGGGPQMENEMEYRREKEYYMQRQMHHPQSRDYYNSQWGGYEQNPQKIPSHVYPHPPSHPQHHPQHPQNHPQHHPNHPQNIPNHPQNIPNHPPNMPNHPTNMPNHPQNMPNHHQGHPSHPDMWVGPNHPGPPLEHPARHMSPHHVPTPVRRPMMSPPGRPDMNHGPYMEPHFADDIGHPSQSPNSSIIPPLMSTTPFNPRKFPDNRPFEPPLRPSQWDGRPGDANYVDGARVRGPEAPYNAPIPPGPAGWNRGPGPELQTIRNRSVERFPGDRAIRPVLTDPQHAAFNRRSEWDRPGQNENPQRFNREARNVSERDPRFRNDHSPQAALSPNATSVKRDPRLVKEPPQPAAPKPKENATNNRDPRRRNSDPKEQNKLIVSSKSARKKNKAKNLLKQKPSANSNDIKSRRSSEEKTSSDKLTKDKESMQSPLESLYGVIDTAAKTGKGYGLQKFKIPKIKRPDPPPPPPPPTPPKIEQEICDEEPPSKPTEPVKKPPEAAPETVKVEEKKMEVSSTTDEPAVLETLTEVKTIEQDLKVSEAEPTITNDISIKGHNPDESEATVDTSTPVKIADVNTSATTESPKDGEPLTLKDEITREWIEKMIKTSLEQGEGKKLLEQAKLLQKLGEGLAHAKKYKKIRKILEAGSESSSSDTEGVIEPKRTLRKKRRVIMSDSSDEASPERKTPEVPEVPEIPQINSPEKPKTPRRRRGRKPRKSKSPRSKKPEPEEDNSENLKESLVASEEALNDSKEPAEPGREPETEPQLETQPEPEPEPELEPEADPEGKVESLALKPRKKTRRRNSLEMLQEDIREMFISEGVVTATGHRMCRLIKEAEGNLKSVDETVQDPYVPSSPEHHDTEVSEDEVLPKRRNRSMSKTRKPREVPDDDKPKLRTRRNRAAKVAKQYASSSDSEEAPRRNPSRASSRKATPEPSPDSKELKDSDKSRETPADESESTRNLRRSERVSLREPRVLIEKTDFGKIDSSKIMFDTSSDESFGIDVSELTAAVDISLHSDRQKRSEDESETIMDMKKLGEKSSRTRKRVSNEAVKATDTPSRADDDAISVASDVSVASSNASSVKKQTTSSKPSNTNEELIANVLGDFVQDTDKEAQKSIDKESDMEVEVEAPKPRKITKKKKPPTLAKRKRKRSNWQMGIVSKSRKSKKKLPRGPEVAKPSLAPQNPPDSGEELESLENFEPPTNPPPKLEKVNIKLKPYEKAPTKPEIKQEKDESVSFLIPDKKKSSFNTQDLIEYAWTGQEKYTCLLCSFIGKNIVHHYKTVHPKEEMMISRLTLLDAKRAIDESKEETFLKLLEKVNLGSERKYTCRFCVFSAEGEKATARETFYEHCTTHTGEYRFRCRSCMYQTPLKSSMRAHYYKICRKNCENVTLAIEEDPIPDENLVNGYLCSVCNFIQLKETNIKQHIDKYHKGDIEAEVIKIDMSIYMDIQNHGDHSDIEDDLKNEDPLAPDSDASTVDLQEYSKIIKKKKMPVKKGKAEIKSKNGENNGTDVSTLVVTSDVSQQPTDSPQSTKLNAFVCPPDLENKEVEIQRERQKTMQELLKNYGTNFKSKSARKGLSITDKLKDKMTTQGRESEGATEFESGEDMDESHSDGLTLVHQASDNNKQADEPIEIVPAFMPVVTSDLFPSISIQTIPKIERSDHEMSPNDQATDKSEKKPRDPLMSLEETPHDLNSAEEMSDGEPMGDISRAYDDSSDTSDVMSDSELSANVNTLLKETINTSTNAPMMTTIQRLAAQLQGSKSTESSPTKSDASKPIVVPLCNLRNFVESQKLLEKTQDSGESDSSRSNTPMNFIRLRRLSGDKLSSGTPVPEPASPIEEETSPEPIPSQLAPDVIENQGEECSFFKIENVISLAPNTSSDPESPLIDDIRKAVATSPVKNVGISVLKKSSPNILKKPMRKPIGKIDGILSRLPPIAPNPNNQPFVLHSSLSKLVNPSQPIANVIANVTKKGSVSLKAVSIAKAMAPAPKVIVPAAKTIPTVPKAIAPAPPLPIPVPALTPISPPPNPMATGSGKTIVAKTTTPTPTNVQVTHQGKNYKLFKVVRPPGLKTKELGSALPLPKEKTFEAFQTMLQPIKLRNLYKCMDRTCTFSTDSAEVFGHHFNAHAQKRLPTTPEVKGEKPPFGYQKCAYCHDAVNSGSAELLAHYKKKHSFCSYQCGYCFYRAFTQSYVDLHQSTVHHGKPSSVILGQRDQHPVEIIDRRENVHAFVCKHECNKLFYVPEAFIAHLKMKHGATLSIFKCHMCPASALKAEALIAHYKMHGIYKYQCLYCLFGADAPMELHQHLSNTHCNRPPKILERSLPPSPERDKDVLLQLLIKNLDDHFKCSELMEIVKTSVGGSIKPLRPISPAEIKTFTLNRKSIKPSDKAEVIDILDVEMPESATLVPFSDKISSPSGSSVLKIVDKAPVVERQPISPTVANSGNASIPKAQQEPELLVRYVNEQVKTRIDSAVDPLSFGHLNITDEFVNINVLDNPEFLKTAEQRASERTPPLKQIEDDKNDDSDIEIIECIEPPSRPKLQLTPIKESLRPFLKLKEEVKEPQSGKTTPTIVFSSNENSNASIEFSGSTEVSAPSECDGKEVDKLSEKDSEIIEKPPSSLDDIKHTGRSGKDLYKCGYGVCDFDADTAVALKAHIVVCPYSGDNVQLKCMHCTKRFVKVGNMLDHLKIHGPKRFGCSLCNVRYPLAYQAVAHMKAKHKISSHKLVPADPGNPSPDSLFNVQPLGPGERKGKKLGKTKSFDSNRKEPAAYGSNDIDKLPRQAIYNQEVRCAVCPYTTKVRTNIIRHLQLHAKDEHVPESGPVNPVPCLDKKEKMFDKMVNLASSSHQNGRMGAKNNKEGVTDSEVELMPKFVPENERYVCCVADCNCLTINEDLLRCHMKALHPEESFFRCPHCPPPGQNTQSIPIDKLGLHLKMHDTRLYKCSHCLHHHYNRHQQSPHRAADVKIVKIPQTLKHVVERHLADKHKDKIPYIKVIREIENPENLDKPLVEEPEEGLSDPDGNHWKCNICDYKCVYKTEMISHSSTTHDEKSQFKCTVCPFKTSGKISFEQHIISKHVKEPEADYTMVYERIKGIKKPDSVEPPVPADEPFDTTPLWRRDMPRIRHIRGILLEEDNGKKSSESPKAAKRKSDIEPASKPAKVKAKSVSLDSPIIIEKVHKPGGSKIPEKTYTHAELKEKFGDYGRPSGSFYSCTMCTTYTSKYRQDIRDHLYMELKYWRWHCRDCGHLAVSHTRMLKHENKSHKDKKPVTVELQEREDIEQWVLHLMNYQREVMRGEGGDPSLSPAKSKAPASTRISPPTIILEDSGEKMIPSSSLEATPELSKTVDLTVAISRLTKNDESDDEDDDGNALVIDSTELDDSKDISSEQIDQILVKDTKNLYICKHCNLEFAGLRGFKIHVQINHLKRLAFICPYCDRSTNSETMMKAHIRTKHQGKQEVIVKNPHANGPELSTAFWEKEYGIVIPKKSKKKKRKFDDVEDTTIEEDKLPLSDICVKCGFTAINSTGLAAHMRAHAKRHSLKCGHCSFTANSQVDIWQHSEINHPQLDWKAEEMSSAGTSQDPPIQHIKKRHIEDYNEDIEEEPAAPLPTQVQPRVQKVFKCSYCKTVRSVSLPALRAHWNQYHKDVNDLSVYQTGVPFKFTESICDIPDMQKQVKCGYCSMKGSTLAVKGHIKKKHSNLPLRIIDIVDESREIWVCKWCNEKVEGVENKTSHHNMFHSHLSMRFHKEESVTKQKGFACPLCPFISATLIRMRTHVAKHTEVFKCKRCLRTFNNLQKATQHSTNEHAGLAAAIERVTNIDALMSKVSQSDLTDIPEDEPNSVPTTDIFRNLGVARKSTTKQLLKKSPGGIRSVARKSTHPLPRYPPGFKFDIEGLDSEVENLTKPVGWSYYGRPPTPVNLGNLNTVMSLGVAKMKVKCTKLAKLMNIDARVVLVDCKKQKTG